jgi:hypothetical protein
MFWNRPHIFICIDSQTKNPIPIEVILNDPDGSETFLVYIEIIDSPGSRLFGANDIELVPDVNGLYTLTPADVQSLTLLPPPNFSTAGSDGKTIDLSVTTVVTEQSNGSTAENSFEFSVDIEGVADKPVATPAQPIRGLEDQPYLIGPSLDLNGVLQDVSTTHTL